MNDTYFDFIHKKELSLTFSMRADGSEAIFLKIRLFRSFQRTQTHASHIILKKMCEDRVIPAIYENWTKWWLRVLDATKTIPSQIQTWCQTLSDVAHPRKRWCAVSEVSQFAKHARSVLGRMHLKKKDNILCVSKSV